MWIVKEGVAWHSVLEVVNKVLNFELNEKGWGNTFAKKATCHPQRHIAMLEILYHLLYVVDMDEIPLITEFSSSLVCT